MLLRGSSGDEPAGAAAAAAGRVLLQQQLVVVLLLVVDVDVDVVRGQLVLLVTSTGRQQRCRGRGAQQQHRIAARLAQHVSVRRSLCTRWHEGCCGPGVDKAFVSSLIRRGEWLRPKSNASKRRDHGDTPRAPAQ